MAWFRFVLDRVTPDASAALLAVPGVTLRDGAVTVHENAAWLVDRVLRTHGIPSRCSVTRPDGERLASIEQLVDVGLREWVPGFLTPYQREAVLDMAHRDGHLWHAAGAGKTLTAIVWALASPGATVIVTRAGVRRSHGREVERFTTHRALVIEEKADLAKLEDTEALFVIVGWEALPEAVAHLLAWRPKNIIFDEAHKAKSWRRFSATPQTDGKLKFDPLENIAQAAYQLSRAKTVQRRLATTATPIKDRTRDLWAQLDLVHPDAWGPFFKKDRASWAGRYCAAHEGAFGGIDSRGSSHLDELSDRVQLVVSQVPHSVTHRFLPPRRRLITYVTADEQCRAEGFTATAMKKVAKNGPSAILEARLMEAAAKKRKVLLELVAECIDAKQKVTIFTGRREDCERLGKDIEKLGTSARMFVGHGGTPASVRDQMQQEYMACGGPAVLVGTGDAWGEGVSLHDTDTAFIAFLPYTPGQVVQWEGRFSRQGQKRPVLVQYLIAEGTVDEHVAGLLLDKLPAVEDVSKDDSLEGFSHQLRGGDNEEAIVAGLLEKLGI